MDDTTNITAQGEKKFQEDFARGQVKLSQDTPEFPSLDYYEKQIIYRSGSRISLLVIASALLELARRADPAYGLDQALNALYDDATGQGRREEYTASMLARGEDNDAGRSIEPHIDNEGHTVQQ